jgi:hypothetical protein
MSDQANKPVKDTDTTTLGLAKIVQRQEGSSSPADGGSGESPTIFFAKAAAETCRQSPKPVVNPKDTGPLPAPSMLGIVSYCYAKGVYVSEEIENKLLKNPEVRAACGNEVPSAGAIRRFRRLNRDAILATLEKFFRKIRKRRPSEVLPGSDPIPAAHQPPSMPASTGGEDTQVFVKREAKDRLDQASFVDGMSS